MVAMLSVDKVLLGVAESHEDEEHVSLIVVVFGVAVVVELSSSSSSFLRFRSGVWIIIGERVCGCCCCLSGTSESKDEVVDDDEEDDEGLDCSSSVLLSVCVC